jgi:hypothetical protein
MDQSAFQVLRALDLATQGDPPQESRVDTFASKLLLELGYASNNSNRDILVREDLSLVICGETRKAKTDVCIRKTDGKSSTCWSKRISVTRNKKMLGRSLLLRLLQPFRKTTVQEPVVAFLPSRRSSSLVS